MPTDSPIGPLYSLEEVFEPEELVLPNTRYSSLTLDDLNEIVDSIQPLNLSRASISAIYRSSGKQFQRDFRKAIAEMYPIHHLHFLAKRTAERRRLKRKRLHQK